MVGENISQKFRLKNIDKTINYFNEEVIQNELLSKNHKKVCAAFYIEHLLILALVVTGCVSIFAILVDIPIGIASCTVGLNICVITAGIKSTSQ